MLLIGAVLIILSFVFGYVGQRQAGGDDRGRSFRTRAISLLMLIGGIGAIISTGFTQIEAGNVGVVSLFGDVAPKPLAQGLHLINPLNVVTKMSVQTQTVTMHAGAANENGAP